MLDTTNLKGFTVERSSNGSNFIPVVPVMGSPYLEYEMNDEITGISNTGIQTTKP